MAIRKLTDFGLNPILVGALLFLVFIGFSTYLFSKTEYAEYVFVLIAWSFASKLSENKRNDFLKSIFVDRAYTKLRLLENTIVVFPFIAFLVYQQAFLSVLILSTLTLLLASVNFSSTFNYTIPTPFYKNPFEFTVGFRSTFHLFVFAYFLTFMAVWAGNFNLGCFALLLVFLVSLSFYSKPENEYYVWSSIHSPKGFLFEKVKTAFIYATFLTFPVVVALGFFFLGEIGTVLILILLGYVYLLVMILAKYSSYPNEINLPQGILIAFSLVFPPFLIGIIPFFYSQSIKRLNDILA